MPLTKDIPILKILTMALRGSFNLINECEKLRPKDAEVPDQPRKIPFWSELVELQFPDED
jgi:hypothetical protein